MTIQEADKLIVTPTLEWMGPPYNSPEARILLLAIGEQESRFRTREQVHGPARGFWQFEFGKGAAGSLFVYSKSAAPFRILARSLNYQISSPTLIANQLAHGADKLACILARWLLYQDKQPLPEKGDEQGAWLYYDRNWCPGKPDRKRWHTSYASALAA